jgi:flagella synthesis protein FlgN
MTGSQQRLLELTAAHIRLLTEMEQVLEAEAQAVGNRRLDDLQSATARKNELLAELDHMGREFTALCESVGVQPGRTGMTGAGATAVMAEAWKRMHALLERCEQKNRSNGIAISASRHFAENLLALLQGQPNAKTYGRNGAVFASAGAKALGTA